MECAMTMIDGYQGCYLPPLHVTVWLQNASPASVEANEKGSSVTVVCFESDRIGSHFITLHHIESCLHAEMPIRVRFRFVCVAAGRHTYLSTSVIPTSQPTTLRHSHRRLHFFKSISRKSVKKACDPNNSAATAESVLPAFYILVNCIRSDLLIILLQRRQIFSCFGELAFLHPFADIPVYERSLGVHQIKFVIKS